LIRTSPLITAISGRFWRTVFAADLPRVLESASSPEGRYHHDGQRALYVSPNPDFSRIAVDTYLRDGDPPRIIMPLAIERASLVDVRRPEVQGLLGLDGTEASTLWQPERAAGRPATSWIASDAVRNTGADGMIYAARSEPTRWHIVLFKWNGPDGPDIRTDGLPIPF
jgi:RES domain-containing protein